MDIESIIALAVIVVGGLISAFKKEKPVQNPNRPVHRQQSNRPQPQHRPQEVPVPQSAPRKQTVETTLEDILSAFGAQSVTTPPPMPKVKKEPSRFIPAHDVPSVTLQSSKKHTPVPKTDVPEFAKIHDIFKEGEIGAEEAEPGRGKKMFSDAEELRRAVIASEILNRKY